MDISPGRRFFALSILIPIGFAVGLFGRAALTPELDRGVSFMALFEQICGPYLQTSEAPDLSSLSTYSPYLGHSVIFHRPSMLVLDYTTGGEVGGGSEFIGACSVSDSLAPLPKQSQLEFQLAFERYAHETLSEFEEATERRPGFDFEAAFRMVNEPDEVDVLLQVWIDYFEPEDDGGFTLMSVSRYSTAAK